MFWTAALVLGVVNCFFALLQRINKVSDTIILQLCSPRILCPIFLRGF